jgi:hypothetical protein
MASFIGRAILWFIVGFILFDIIREFNKLFNRSLNPYYAIIPAVLNYLFQEYLFKKWEALQEAPAKRVDKILIFMGWIIVGSFCLCVFIVWALVIYKASIKGGL